MAKAKIVRRRRRLRLEGVATLLLIFGIFVYAGAKFGLHTYNIRLQKQSQELQVDKDELRESVANLENEVNTLQSRDRVLSMVKDEGITTNQNVVVVGQDK